MTTDGFYLPEVPPLLAGMRGQSYNLGSPGAAPQIVQQMPPMEQQMQQQMQQQMLLQQQMPPGMPPGGLPPGMSYHMGAPTGPQQAAPNSPGVLPQGMSYHMTQGAAPPAIMHAPQLLGGPVPRGAAPPQVQATAVPMQMQAPQMVTAPQMQVPMQMQVAVAQQMVPAVTQAPAQFEFAPGFGGSYAAPAPRALSYVPPVQYQETAVTMASSYAAPVGPRVSYSQPLSPSRTVLPQSYSREDNGLTGERPIARAGNDTVIGERQISRDELMATGNLLEDAPEFGRGRQYQSGLAPNYESSASAFSDVRRSMPLDPLNNSYSGGYGYREPARASNADFGREINPSYDTSQYSRNPFAAATGPSSYTPPVVASAYGSSYNQAPTADFRGGYGGQTAYGGNAGRPVALV